MGKRKTRLSRRRTSRRTSRVPRARRRVRKNGALRRNPILTTKALLLGGVVLGGGALAYFAKKTLATPPPPPPLPPGADAAAQAAQCQALEQRLAQLRAMPSPPIAEVSSTEQQIHQCWSAVRQAGGPVEPSGEARAAADALHSQIEASFSELKATDYSDILKRGNILGAILGNGDAMARQYAEAVAQAPTVDSAKLARSSIIRALGAAMTRRDCYAFDQPGCGRYWGSTETDSGSKAAAEQNRIINPLLAAYSAAAAKFSVRASSERPLTEQYVQHFVDSASRAKDRADGIFGHYKATEYSDVVNRNDRRMASLDAGAMAVQRLREAYGAAEQSGSAAGMRNVATIARTLLSAAIDRWSCYVNGAPGCGRFALNEDHGFDKAAQERDRVIAPAAAVARDAAVWLARGGDTSAFAALVDTKLRLCKAIKDFVNAKYGEYKATDYTDAVKRNNVRQEILSFGEALAACLDNAVDAAGSIAVASGAKTSSSGLLGIGGYSGLGQASPTQVTFTAPMLMAAMRRPLPAAAASVAATAIQANVAARNAAALAALRSVAGVLKQSLDASIERQFCYLDDAPGCGRFGVNEDHGNDKAGQERDRVRVPLTAAYEKAVRTLLALGDAQAEVPLTQSKLRDCRRLKDYTAAKWSEYTSVSWNDWIRRNNVRGVVIQAGRDLVACLRGVRPQSAAGRKDLRSFIEGALADSRARIHCIQHNGPGCGRWCFGDCHEPDPADMIREERDNVTAPLEALLASTPLSGLGQSADAAPGVPWLGLGLAALTIGAVAMTATSRRPRANRRAKRRTSRRFS